MPNYRSLVPGGFFADPDTSTANWSVRSNNPGAINGNAQWVQDSPGFVKTVTIGGGNPIAVFETPENGLALYWTLLKRYGDAGAKTVGQIITRYGGGQDYSAYVDFVSSKSGLAASKVIDLADDATLIPFAKAMFRYEAGSESPLSDAQFKYGFALARGKAPQPATQRPSPLAPPIIKSTAGDSTPQWLLLARSMIGKVQDGPTIVPLAQKVGEIYPEMKNYAAMVGPTTSWCGDFVAYCLAMSGIRPVYTPGNDLNSFLWADAWRTGNWGATKVNAPQPGDVLTFDFGGGDHHVTFFDHLDANGNYVCLGGNQSDQVKLSSYARSQCTAILRPPNAAPAVIEVKPPSNGTAVGTGVVAGFGIAALAHWFGAHPIATVALAALAGLVVMLIVAAITSKLKKS